jgi:type IV secretion system protein VirD4
MMERPLLTADELKSLPKGNFVIMKTGVNPMKTVLRLFLDWGICFGDSYVMEEKSHRKVAYADKESLEQNIIFGMGEIEELEFEEERRNGGITNTQKMLSKIETGENKRRPTLRT